MFALAGATVARHVLGAKYGGGTGAELGRLVVYFAPWMVASVALTIAYPLLFVARPRALAAAARRRCAARAGAARVGRARARSASSGLAGGLAITTALVLAALLVGLRALRMTLARRRRRRPSSAAALAALSFGVPRIVLGPFSPPPPSASSSTRSCSCVWRPPGLRHAWAYVRALQ